MTKIKIDIDKYNEIINNINMELNSFNDNIDSFFKEIVSMEGWKGDKSKEYIDKSLVEKLKYENFSSSLNIAVNYISGLSDSLKTICSSFK